MLQHKDIKITELQNLFDQNQFTPAFIYDLFKLMPIKKIAREFSFLKQKGYTFDYLFTLLMSLVLFGEESINSFVHGFFGKIIIAKKDSFYRFKNLETINWRHIVWKFSHNFRQVIAEKSELKTNYRCLIFDDTLIEKTGQSIEFISKVFDHVTGQYKLGFKLLAMIYYDGVSSIPLDFSLHREQKNKEKTQLKQKTYKIKRITSNPNKERAEEIDEKKTTQMLKMFKRAINNKIEIDYVLIDSWFTHLAIISEVIKENINLIGMYKIPKTKFEWQGKYFTSKELRYLLGKPKRCKGTKYFYLQAKVNLEGNPIQLFFSRQGKNGKWKLFLTTDISLSFKKMIEIYQIRWTIEVFFKECKQMLGLEKCQSRNFDAHIAHISMIFIQHILLTLKFRFEQYESKGALFRELENSMQNQKLHERLYGLLIAIIEVFGDSCGVDELELMEKILNDVVFLEKIKNIFTYQYNESSSQVG